MDVSEDIYKKIGENLGKIRNDRNKTQQEIAKQIGINRENYTSIENGSGKRHLKDYQIIELSKLYNVSADYILGLTDETSSNINIKDIYETYGLTEQSLINLQNSNATKMLSKKKNDDKSKEYMYSVIETINILLSELYNPSQQISLINYINTYINLNINKDYIVNIQKNGEVEVYNKKDKAKHKKYITMSATSLIDIILLKIQQKLGKMREEKQKQLNVENNSKN